VPQRRGLPASKQDLIEAADRNGCDEQTVRALRAVPPETYANLAQVAASVTVDDDRGGDGAGEAAAQSPIVQELGENRGS
ncbi:hypothetical protein MTAB308_987, partial [Mycobacterium terramassiliense]